MFNVINFTKPVDLKNFTVIVPSVSVGNVGQLTADLLISSQEMVKVATLWDPAIVPAVGSNPFNYNTEDVCTACELFVNEELNLAVLQLRSTIEYQLALDFLKKLCRMFEEQNVKDVLILTSTFAHELHNIDSGVFRFATNNSDHKQKLCAMKVLELEKQSTQSTYLVYGGGFASKLYELMQEIGNSTLLVKYSSEGDNRPDAMQTLNILGALLKLKNESSMKFPSSWQFVFGNPPPIGIF